MSRFRKKKTAPKLPSYVQCLCVILFLCIGFVLLKQASFLLLPSDETPSKTMAQQPSADFVMFINIPGTGNAPVLTFLHEYSGLESFRNYFVGLPWVKPHHRDSISCIFWPKTTKRKRINVSTDCLHLEYAKTRNAWRAAAGIWMDRELANTNIQEIRVSSETFAMVRHPFDRLRSYFDILHKGLDGNLWKDMNTDAQNRRVKEGDFHGWMELAFVEQAIPHGSQYHFIDDDVDKAISLITGDSPNVTVLVYECFEASLQVLENKLSLKKGAVDTFLRSRSTLSMRGNVAVWTNLTMLQERSKRYFPKEYKFYNATVEQFRLQLSLGANLLHYPCDL